jgi:Nif-specific regulatory protein
VDNFKKEFIRFSLENCAGNRSAAARRMGIQRTYLSRLLARYDLT